MLLLSTIHPLGIYIGIAAAALLLGWFLFGSGQLLPPKRNKKQFERQRLRERIGNQINKWDTDETKSIAKDEAIILVKILCDQFEINREEVK